MPLGDIAGEVLGGIVRIIGQFILEVVFELLIKGPGYLICRVFRKDINSDGPVVVLVGFTFWAALLVAIYAAYSLFVSSAA